MRPLRSILLTGGAGFVGSNLARHLLAKSGVERLVVLDTLHTKSNRDNLIGPDQDPRFEFVEGDIQNTALLSELLRYHATTGVFNLAEVSQRAPSATNLHAFIETNISGTTNLLETCRAAGVPLLQCSTDEVYGPIAPPEKCTEDHPPAPSSPYAASKTAADLFCRAAFNTHRQDVVITRSSTNYGPKQQGGNLIPFVIQNALHDEPIPLYGGGMQIRDWIHVDDHCRGLVAAFERGKPGQTFNFGGHTERTHVGVTRNILKILGKPDSLINTAPDRPGHDSRHSVDTSKALNYLSWDPMAKMSSALPVVVRELAARIKQASQECGDS